MYFDMHEVFRIRKPLTKRLIRGDQTIRISIAWKGFACFTAPKLYLFDIFSNIAKNVFH